MPSCRIFFYLTPTKKLFIIALHQLITDVRFRALFCGCLYEGRKKSYLFALRQEGS